MLKWLRYIVLFFVTMLVALFLLDNRQSVEISLSLFGWSLEAPFFVWLCVAFLCGILVVMLWFVLSQLSAARTMKNQYQEIKVLREELNALKCETAFKQPYDEQRDYVE